MVVRAWSEMESYHIECLTWAFQEAQKSECLSSKVGAIAYVEHGIPVYEGYNQTYQTVQKVPTCKELGACPEDSEGHCTNTIHAEVDCLIQTKRAINALYITREPCYQCANLIALYGVQEVVVLDGKPNPAGREVLERHGIPLVVVTGWQEVTE